MKEALILNKEIDADRSEFVSDPIGEFYTRHPYPPPVENLDRARDEWRDINRHRAEFHLFWPHKSYRADFSVLVAGCGTWQAAKFALCHPSATVIGIDISPTSLTETERLKKKYKLSNLETVRLRVEEAASLDKQFDLIVCTGVLHHLNNPEEGLRALRDVLNPCGAMYLMVYAKYGRAGIYMLQEYCRRLGIGNSSKEIAELNEVVTALPAQHPLAMLFRGSRDAGSADALADALLNPRDRAYSVSEVLDSIDQAGMSFGRWYWQAPYLPHCGAISATSHSARLGLLTVAEQYAAMELWRGTMTAHSFTVYQSGARGPSISFDLPDWQKCVPIRLPSTLCIEERLPAGAACVLINRSHQFHDLVLPLNARQKAVFDRIDGRRAIAEIVENPDDMARGLFEKLWQYDQVVFDASRLFS